MCYNTVKRKVQNVYFLIPRLLIKDNYFLLLSSYENSSRNQNDNYAYIVIKIAIIIWAGSPKQEFL